MNHSYTITYVLGNATKTVAVTGEDKALQVIARLKTHGAKRFRIKG